jgi:hypothetical protein
MAKSFLGRLSKKATSGRETGLTLGESLYRITTGKIKNAPPKTVTATNPQTGEKIMSADGGKTWSPVQ